MAEGRLVIAVHDGSSLDGLTRELVAAAQTVAGPTTLGIIAAAPEALADQVHIAGVDEIVTIRVTGDQFEPEQCRHAVRALIEDARPRLILMGFTAGVASYGAAVANELELGFAADVIGLRLEDGQVVATRPLYGGKVHGELDFDKNSPVLILLRPGVWEAAAETDTSPPGRELPFEPVATSVEHLESVPRPMGGVDLAAADIIFAVGRGVGEQDRIDVFQDIAKRMGAALGASRPVVDAGWLPRDRQVGQSGQSVKPRVYVAFGISGAFQHLVGIRGTQTIVAVNKDENAPIFNVAHLGAVADMFAVAEELQALVKQADDG